MGKKLGYKKNHLPITENLSKRILRLPLYHSLSKKEMDYVIGKINHYFAKSKNK
jgi:dTDP-4-amino-4,6-dideoxygalactose transaminase